METSKADDNTAISMTIDGKTVVLHPLKPWKVEFSEYGGGSLNVFMMEATDIRFK